MTPLMPTSPARRITIIAVDDEVTVLALMVETLEDMGFEALAATGAESAMALMAAHPEVDLLVTDVRMPGMTGVELATEARQQHPNMPIVFVTGYAAELQNGVRNLFSKSAMLTKPFRLDSFADTVKSMVCPAPTN